MKISTHSKLRNLKKISNASPGFSLIELVISISIISIITTVIIFNQNDFNKTVKLQNLAHEIATLIRDVQVQAVDASTDTGRGIFYDNSGVLTIYETQPVDTSVNRSAYVYEHSFSDDEFDSSLILDQITIPGNFVIKEVCLKNVNPLCSGEDYSVAFARPELQAHFSYNRTEIDSAKWLSIEIASTSDLSQSRFVIINQSGLIYTSNELPE